MTDPDDLARVPVLPRGVRLAADRVRGGTVLLGPERSLMLDEIGVAILSEIDGTRRLEEIARALAERYGAPAAEVTADVAAFVGDLADKRLVDLHDG